MPYQSYGWGDALAAWGNTLSRWGQRKEEEAMNRLKNRYGNNVEQWRQDALKNPQGEEAKYYKKFVGDPNQKLPEDPQMAQQREMMARQDQFYKQIMDDPNIPEETKRMIRVARNANIAGINASAVEPIIRAMGQRNAPQYTPLEMAKSMEETADRFPTATPKAVEQYGNYRLTGKTPAKINLENTPGNTAGIMGGLQQGGTAGMIGQMQKQYQQASVPELLGEMGKTKQQIKQEDIEKTRKLKAEQMATLEQRWQTKNERDKKYFELAEKRFAKSGHKPGERDGFKAAKDRYYADRSQLAAEMAQLKNVAKAWEDRAYSNIDRYDEYMAQADAARSDLVRKTEEYDALSLEKYVQEYAEPDTGTGVPPPVKDPVKTFWEGSGAK